MSESESQGKPWLYSFAVLRARVPVALAHWVFMEDWKRRRAKLEKFYKSAIWHKTRELALKRDNYLCVECFKKGDIIPAEVVHHKTHLTEENVNNPDIALNLENLVSLCAEHHFDEHKGEHAKGRVANEGNEYNYIFDANGMLIPKA